METTIVYWVNGVSDLLKITFSFGHDCAVPELVIDFSAGSKKKTGEPLEV